MEPGDSSSARRARLDVPQRLLQPAVQSALYAAERQSHAIWISHTINLVVISEPLEPL